MTQETTNALLTAALDDAGAFLAAHGFPPLTAAEREEIAAQLRSLIARSMALPPKDLESVIRATTLDLVEQVVIVPCGRTPEENRDLGIALCIAGTAYINEHVPARYLVFTEEQRGALMRALTRKADSLVKSGLGGASCLEALDRFLPPLVLLTLGPPDFAPAPAPLLN